MAITFIQAKKRQKYLIFALTLIILVIIFVVWQGFFKEETSVPSSITPVVIPTTINIDWQTLEGPQLEKMQLFGEITPFKNQIGRDNPFVPY